MTFRRASGVILHPTSLPGKGGIGCLGPSAYAFVDWLVEAGQRLWQVCPLGPTGYGNSPYQCFSAHAGNPLLCDLDPLVSAGWLEANEVAGFEPASETRVDYEKVIAFKWPLLAQAAERFVERAPAAAKASFARFCQDNEAWLDEFALFMSLKEQAGGVAWDHWERPLRLAEAAALATATQELAAPIAAQKFAQYLFFEQWLDLKAYANKRGIKIIGDIPIFVALDSADVWGHPELFLLDEDRRPTAVAGVPPDYFSATGQLWGNPLYDWDAIAQSSYTWWIDTFRSKLTLYDGFRLDHFRGFAAYWAVPAGETTAMNGTWQPGPGKALFEALERDLGHLPLIAEDLGVITPDVEQLRDHFGYPGMKILQFAFDSEEDHEFRPHTYVHNCVAYTGTHDNDTIVGWHETAKPVDRAYAEAYLHSDGSNIAWDFVRNCWASTAVLALAPLQDLLALGSEARMNTPGTLAGNWEWRCRQTQLTSELAERLRTLSEVYCR